MLLQPEGNNPFFSWAFHGAEAVPPFGVGVRYRYPLCKNLEFVPTQVNASRFIVVARTSKFHLSFDLAPMDPDGQRQVMTNPGPMMPPSMVTRLLLFLVTLFTLRSLAGEQATAVATLTAGFVTGITVTFGGSGYTSEPAVTISGGGGRGAEAKAILNGDKVGLVLVLKAGSGYTAIPVVTVEPPPRDWELGVRQVPEITVFGPVGAQGLVEWCEALGPGEVSQWQVLTNVTIGRDGVTVVDLAVGSSTRFYRTFAGPAGFVWIQPGTFVMGSPVNEAGRKADEIQHKVTLTRGYWLSDHEVTQAEYQAVMGSNPSTWKGEDLPVDTVSWPNAVLYCKNLTQREVARGRLAVGHAYRLPTEAEWEYAARAGTMGASYGESDTLAWSTSNSGGQTHSVKGKLPNAWGLHDMIGNVWEWCSDWYGNYPTTNVIDPTGSTSGERRVVRGCGWDNDAVSQRFAVRNSGTMSDRYYSIGFRCVLGQP